MTAGSYDRGSYTTVSGGRIGVENTRSWSGADTPQAPRPARGTYQTVRAMRRKDGTVFYKAITVRYPLPIGETVRKRKPENPYTLESFYHRGFYAAYHPSSGGGTAAPMGIMTAANGIAQLLNANDQIALIGKLREKLYGSDFNASVLLGESRQTLNLIADSAIRIAKAGYHVRRGDLSGAARSLLEGTSRRPLMKRHEWDPKAPSQPFLPNAKGDLSTVSRNWLELQYGWLPLMSDAKASAEMVAHHLEVPLQTTYRVSKSREALFPFTMYTGTDLGYLRSVTTKSHRRSIIARISEADQPSVARKLGLLDPELVAWELVPFSFVADWFIPIGSWMEARALASSLKGTFITSDLMKVHFHPESVSQQAGTLGTRIPNMPSGMKYDRVRFTRAISSSLAVPMPTMKPLKEAASWQHLTNALALVTQVFTRQKIEVTPATSRAFRTPAVMPESNWHF